MSEEHPSVQGSSPANVITPEMALDLYRLGITITIHNPESVTFNIFAAPAEEPSDG